MANSTPPIQEGNPTARPGSCNPFTVEFMTSTAAHKAGSQQYIESTDMIFGRAEDCEVRFGDDCKTVSRKHASIKCMGNKYVLEHLSENNPTFVNGKNVSSQYTLSHRDTIQFSENGPKILFIAPGAMGSNAVEEDGQKTVRGNASNAENTQRPSAAATATVAGTPTSSSSMSCLPFTIEFGKRSQLNYQGQRKTISDATVLIGRAANAAIRFGEDCNEVSTEHAILRCRGGQWYLEHKSKTNSTYLNGRQITSEELLTHESTIHFASMEGQFIRFYQSGSAGTTGRVQGDGYLKPTGTMQAQQPSFSTRIGEMLKQSNKKQRWVSIGLGVGILLVSAVLFLVRYENQQRLAETETRHMAEAEAANKKQQEEKALEDLRNNFPERDFENFIFFADGQFNYLYNGETYGPFSFEGTAFLDNKGHLLTARHVIEIFDFPEICEVEVLRKILKGIGAKPKLKWTFKSPIAKEMVIQPTFEKANTEPIYNINLKGCEKQVKTCAPTEDWAVSTPPELKKLAESSTIIIDREYSKDMSESMKLYVLGYKDSKSDNPQLKPIVLDNIHAVEGGLTQVNFFKSNNTGCGEGDSGAPVFAFREDIKKWVVVGMYLKKEKYWDEESDWDIILPIYLIPENYLN